MNQFVKGTALLVAATIWTGCGVQLEGEEGNLSFRYLGTEMTAGASAGTLAVGAKVDVEVREAGGEDALAIAEAYSEAADVIDVIAREEMSFTLEAKEAGTARIRAEARTGGETLEDSVEIQAAEAVSIEFRSRCTDDVFVTDSGAEFGFRLNDLSGRKLTGYGLYPAAVEPAEGGAVVTTGQKIDVLEVNTGSEAGIYELVSELEGDNWSFQLVSPEQIELVEINREDDETVDQVEVGQEVGVAYFTMTADSKTVCGPARAAVELTTTTPEICQPSYRFLSSLHFVFVEGIAAGDCEVNLAVADTALEQSFTVQVQ